MKSLELQVGVKIFLKNKEGKYLLLQRSADKYKDLGGIWDIPGGRIIPGETLLHNLKREIKEETNLDYKGEPLLIFAQDILRLPVKHVVRLSYTGNIDGEVKIDSESTAYKWLTPVEMKQEANLDQYVREIIEKGLLG